MDGAPRRCALTLILPAYNEEAGIGRAVAEADAALARLGLAYEILVIDDGSRDGTAMAAREAAAQRPCVAVLQHLDNRGYGAALRTGFEAARGDRVAFTDADCQFDLADLGRLLPLTETHPIAVGYRVDRQDSRMRKFYSRGYNVLARALLGTTVRDIDCALKIFRRDALLHLLPESPGFFVNTEMLTRARQLGLSVAEIGVRHRPRLRGASKVSLWDIPRTLRALLPFWWSQVLFAKKRTVATCTAVRVAADVPLHPEARPSIAPGSGVGNLAPDVEKGHAGDGLERAEQPQSAADDVEIPRLLGGRIEGDVLGMLDDGTIAVLQKQGERTEWPLAKQALHLGSDQCITHSHPSSKIGSIDPNRNERVES